MIDSDTIGHAWLDSLRLFLDVRNSTRYDSARGPCFEVRDLPVMIRSPATERHVPGFPEPLEALIDSFVDRFMDQDSARNSTLASRLYRWPREHGSTFDQIAHARKVARENPETRFNIVSVWDPNKDPEAENPVSPLVAAFHVRPAEGVYRLHATLMVRTLDAWLGAVPMLVGFSTLQAHLAESANCLVGGLAVFVLSYHVYEMDLPIVRETANRMRE
jgi:hypothetical protein